MEFSIAQAASVISLFLFAIFFVLGTLIWLGRSKNGINGGKSPYTGRKMRRGSDIAQSIQEYVNQFLREEASVDNPIIDFSSAAICSETGRIFTHCVTSRGEIYVTWDFLQKRVPGNYISWGVLSEHEKAVMRLLHGNIEGFQTAESSTKIEIKNIEPQFALLSPGPLYVDRKTKIIIGWKKVYGTHFEVLVVQRPLYQSIDDTL